MEKPAERLAINRELSVDIGQTHGVTWDGEALWCVDARGPALLRVDVETGRVDRRLTGFPADAGTGFDGDDVWQIGGDCARKIDRETGSVLATLQLPDDGVSGLSWADGAWWVGNHRGKHILRIDASSGRVVSRFESDCHVCGVTFAGGELWHCAWTSPMPTPHGWAELRQLDTSTGAVLRRFLFPDWVAGIEADQRGRLWLGVHHGGRVLEGKHPGRPR